MVPFMAKRYPESVKQSVSKQILDGSYFLAEIAKMNNIAYSSLFRWKSELLRDCMNQHKFSSQKKLDILFATASMSETEISKCG